MTAPLPQFQLFMMGRLLLARPMVLSVKGTERANDLYAFDVRFILQMPDDLLADNSLLEQPVHLTLLGGESPRKIHGIVEDIGVEPGSFQERSIFTMRIGPQLGLLRFRRYCRIFNDMTALEIVTTILNENRIPFRLRFETTFTKRRYTVQYNESDYEFLLRMLADIGLFFSFDHPSSDGPGNLTNMGGSEIVVIGDSARSYAPVEGTSTLVYAMDSDALVASDTHVFAFTANRRPRPTMTLERAYDYQKPPVELRDTATAQTGGPPHLVYTFGGAGDESPPDIVPAAVRLEQERADALVGRGESACRRLMPGRTFNLEGHEVASLSMNYVVTVVEHVAYAAEVAPAGTPIYRNKFSCVPASVPIRPGRIQKPQIQGVETARVVGPQGKEIHVDSEGRVQVQFHWDLAGKDDGSTSTWLRVRQQWAGASFGAQFIPRIGNEVVVNFLQGDIDRPFIDGMFYNRTHPYPFILPDSATVSGWRTQSSPGGGGQNQLSFEDAKDKELVLLQAQRDLEILVKHDETFRIGHDRVGEIGENDQLTVGKSRTVTVAGTPTGSTMSSGTISSTTGGATLTLSGNDATLKAAGNISLNAGGNVSVDAGGEVTVKAGTVAHVKAPVVEIKGDAIVVIEAGANIVVHSDGPVSIKGAVITEN